MWPWAVVLILFALAVKATCFVAIDAHVDRWMEVVGHLNVALAARTVSFFGSVPWTLSMFMVMGAWWIAQKRYRTLLACVGAGLIGLMLQCGLRLWVGQWRPDVE